MVKWKLHVKGLGKIKQVELDYAPLILFVGDNNSGKSYLLTLLWGIYTSANRVLLDFDKIVNDEIGKNVLNWLDEMITQFNSSKMKTEINLAEKRELIEDAINLLCKRNKDKFVESIFNSNKVKIDEMYITLSECDKEKLFIEYESNDIVKIKYGGSDIRFSKEVWDDGYKNFIEIFLWDLILTNLLGIERVRSSFFGESCIFLPSARTGFMLTKDTINKVGRRITFDIDINEKEEISVQPFTKPIIRFLDAMEELSHEVKGDASYDSIVKFIEENIVYGTIDMTNDAKKEVNYNPIGAKESIPLRVSSAVVSELSPLVLLLKYKKYISKIFYEEPEMCLHPQLQKLLARVLCLMVKKNIPIVATTHSDIIVQHINNMIKLSTMEPDRANNLISGLGYEKGEIVNCKDVKIYQFKNKNEFTEVTELECTKYGFEVPTFNDALDKLVNEIIEIQD